MKDISDNNFIFDENSRKFSRWVGNTVEKGEISPFPCVFKGVVPQTHKNKGLSGKGLIPFRAKLGKTCRFTDGIDQYPTERNKAV